MKTFDFYNVKIIETPTSIEVWEYTEKPVFYTINNTHKKDILNEDNIHEKKEEKTANVYDKIKRKQKHYNKMRWEIARIIDCNFDDNTKFMTLTFKENITDIEYTNKEFNKFIKRLNYKIYKTKKSQLKYLAVWEKQKRGAIHYHIIFFSLPYIKNKELTAIWGHGFVKINKIDVDSKDNRGRYVSKYFSKDIDIKNYKQKAFFKSQNLKLPEINLLKIQHELNFLNNDVIYTKTYTRKSPDFDNSGLKFTDSLVKYTRIRKE